MGENFVSDYNVDYRAEASKHSENATFTKREKTKVIARPNIVKTDIRSIKNTLNQANATKIGFKKTKKICSKFMEKYRIVFYKMLLSSFILIVTLTGLIVVINRFSSLEEAVPASNMHVNSAADFSKFLAPIVMHNPDPFDSPKEADKQMKISSSIWHCVMKNGANVYKNFDERGLTLIPAKEIETSCEELFGPDHSVDFSQRAFGPFYNMEAGEKNFHISTVSNQDCYLPYIENIAQTDPCTIKITVGYVVREDPFFTHNSQKNVKPIPKKRMLYTLKKSKNSIGYFVNSISQCDQ